MKMIGYLIASCAAATASAAICDPPACATCIDTGGNVIGMDLMALATLAVGVIGIRFFKARPSRIAPLLGVLLAFASPSFGAEKKSPDPGSTPIKTTIAQILAKPEDLAGKQVTVTARLSDVCTDDGCMTLKDKFDVIEGVPPAGGFKKTPKVGATLNVTGQVKVKGEGERKVVTLAVTGFEEAKK